MDAVFRPRPDAELPLVLPFMLQGLALYRVNTEIAELQPAVAHVKALRRSIGGDIAP